MSKLQNFWGMNPGGPASNPVGGSIFSWDIFDNTRMIAQGRPHGTGPANVPPQKVGSVTANAYRSHESIHLLDQNLFRTRQLGSFWDRIDSRGQNYVARQANYLGQKFKNAREFVVSRMMRGEFEVRIDGDNWLPTTAGNGQMTVSFGVPATNQGTLGGILVGDWQLTTADILGEILAVNAQMEQDHGWPLRHLWVNSTTYGYMLNNATLQTVAGTSNTVFDVFTPTSDGADGYPDDTGFLVRFKALPWLDVHVYDGGLMVDNGTAPAFDKFIPDNRTAFLPDPMPEVAEWLEGSELIRETVVSEPSEKLGLSAWTTPAIDPAGFSLKAVDSGLPALYVPKIMNWGTTSATP